jgi:hypothetical protein
MNNDLYNSVIPSSLLDVQDEDTSGLYKHAFMNFSLKSGVVLKCYETTDSQNLNKLVPEYDVCVIEQDENRGVTSVIYHNCVMKELFGGIGDFFEYKLRLPMNDNFKSNLNSIDQTGSIVLLLCLDGVDEKGLILGCLSHPRRKSTLTKENGQHLEGEFNGVNCQINSSGEFTITYKSKTDENGIYADSTNGGTFLKFEKDGSIVLSDNNTSKIKIDKAKKEVRVEANGATLNLKEGKVALGTSSNELLNIVIELLNKLLQAQATFCKTAVGPGILDTQVVSAISETKSKLNSIKGSI